MEDCMNKNICKGFKYCKLGIIYSKINIVTSIDNFLRALELNNCSDLNEILGMGYNNLGENEKSLEYLSKAIELNPNNISALLYLGKMYTDIDEEKTQNYFSKAIDIEPQNPLIYFHIALLKNNSESITLLQKSIELDDTFSDAYFELGEKYYENGEYEEAIKILELAMKHCPEDEDVIEEINNYLTYCYSNTHK